MKYLNCSLKYQTILVLVLLTISHTYSKPTTEGVTSNQKEGVRTTFDLSSKYTNMGPLQGGVANLMQVGLTLPNQISPYSLGLTSNQITPVVANLQPQPGFLQNSQNAYLPSYTGGWGVVTTPVSAPPPMSTLALETSLNMDSTGVMASYHEEYLHLLGNYHNPAMAQTIYGSDAHHGLYGSSGQATSGTQISFQESIGHVEGITSQLYDIATMGDQNQAISTGFSDATGTGNVAHQSSSTLIKPSSKR